MRGTSKPLRNTMNKHRNGLYPHILHAIGQRVCNAADDAIEFDRGTAMFGDIVVNIHMTLAARYSA